MNAKHGFETRHSRRDRSMIAGNETGRPEPVDPRVTKDMDPNNHVVRLCAEGMQAESDGRLDEAKTLFERAWAGHTSDLEACIAAHYLARQQKTVEDEFRWNKEALERASGADGELVRAFYASLYLNIGHSHEQLGNLGAARSSFELAEAHLGAVPDSPYKDIVRRGIANGLSRTEPAEP